MNTPNETEAQLVARIAKQYASDGYQVYLNPKPAELPFELGSYRPDIIAMKSPDDGFVVEVKSRASKVSVDQFRQISETINAHKGWRFILYTSDDLGESTAGQMPERRALSWSQIRARESTGESLLESNEYEAAFLTLWGSLEAAMRQRAQQMAIPIDQFPTTSLINQLYSQGELSMKQFDKARELMNIRNQLAHGFQTTNVERAARELQELMFELYQAWHSE